MARSKRTPAEHDDVETRDRIEAVREHVRLLKLDPTARERVFIESSFVTAFYSDYLTNLRQRLPVQRPNFRGDSPDAELIGELRGKRFFELLDALFKSETRTEALKTLVDIDPALDRRSVLLWAFLGLPAGFRPVVPTLFAKGRLTDDGTLERVKYVELKVLSRVKAESVSGEFEAALDRAASQADRREPDAQNTLTAHMTASLRTDPVSHLVLVVRAPWPTTSTLESFARDALATFGDQLAANVVVRNEFGGLVRLWATDALVGFAGLSARQAMGTWDNWIVSPSWGQTDATETQSHETAFSRARSGLEPRQALYLSLLQSIKP